MWQPSSNPRLPNWAVQAALRALTDDPIGRSARPDAAVPTDRRALLLYCSRLRSIHAVFSWICRRWVARSAVA